MTSTCLKYLAFKTCETNEPRLQMMRHNCIANKALLKEVSLRKPILLRHLGLHNTSHDFQCGCFFPLSTPHQKLEQALSMSEQIDNGIRKHDIAYVGMA